MQTILALLIGIFAGTITGLIPGLHLNLVAATITTIPALTGLGPLPLAIFVFAMAITHTFIDAIPSALLGVPNPDTAELVLPAHRMVVAGEGYEVIRLATMGGIVGMIVGVLVFSALVRFTLWAYALIAPYVGWVILAVAIFFIVTESSMRKKVWAAIIFLLCGALGSAVLSSYMDQPLLPLLSGLFGVSTLLISLFERTVLAVQVPSDLRGLQAGGWLRATIAMLGAAAISAMLPGLGTAQATMAAKSVLGKGTEKFIVATGGINTLSYLFSLATWLALDKARNGAVVALSTLIGAPTIPLILCLLAVSLAVAGIAALLTLGLGRLAVDLIERVPYQHLSVGIILFLVLMTALLSGPMGLLVLATSTALGVLTHLVGVRKSVAMGCLVVPVVFYLI